MELQPDHVRSLATELIRGAELAAAGHHTPDPALGEFSHALSKAIESCSRRSLHLKQHAESIAERAANYMLEVEDIDQELGHTLGHLA
ncbi:hypothetical protein [Corynebacterium freiburgense]|uniref:hypothetical protein n=1 Tax=Corynebacterium freiburgense TaxID=556548 RepID=UPI000420E942|nr:hypothetical protein [Corynebacterium freiburgense]WJZ01821.1 hypothetical protein CFREI_02585 [Corynebacterium freiburgense]